MRTRSGLQLWCEAWLIYAKELRAVASSEVGHKTTSEETFIPSGRGSPQSRPASGSVAALALDSFFFPCVLIAQVPWALLLPSLGKEAPLWPAPCISLVSWAEASTGTILRATQLGFGLWWFSAFYGFRAKTELPCWAEWLPNEFQVPLCEWMFFISSGGVGTTMVELCFCAKGATLPTPPTPFPNAKYHRNPPSLELEPKPVVDRGCWGCKAARNGSHEPPASYALTFPVAAESGAPALVLGRCEWWKGGTHTTGQQIIQTLRSAATSRWVTRVCSVDTRVESIWNVCHSALSPPPSSIPQ